MKNTLPIRRISLSMLGLLPLSACGPIEPWAKPYERDRLAHPIMASWSLQNRLASPAVGPDILTRTGLTAPQMVTVILREMDGWSEKEQFLAAVRSGLQGQAGWLRIEGDETTAQLALTLANHTTMTPSQNPLVARLVASGIEHSFAPRT